MGVELAVGLMNCVDAVASFAPSHKRCSPRDRRSSRGDADDAVGLMTRVGAIASKLAPTRDLVTRMTESGLQTALVPSRASLPPTLDVLVLGSVQVGQEAGDADDAVGLMTRVGATASELAPTDTDRRDMRRRALARDGLRSGPNLGVCGLPLKHSISYSR